MPRPEHGFYDSGEDAGADAGVFDASQGEDEAENSRLPLLIVLALLVLAMFAGFVWLAYNEGVARGLSENSLLASDTGKTAPGSSVPYKGFKIYEQPAPPDDEEGHTGQASVPVEPAKARAEASEPAARAPQPATAPARSMVAVQAPAEPTVLARQTSAPSSRAAVLQIGAYKSDAEAMAAWETYKRRHASLLAGYSPDVARADLGEKGTWYRLRISGFSSKDAASALCERLKADSGACFLGQ